MSIMSTVGGMAKDAATSALGIVSKAQLIFNTIDTPAATKSLQSFANTTRSALSSSGNTGSNGSASPSLNGQHIMEVQYNPSSISIQASAESIPFQMLQDNINSTIPNQNWRDPSVVLSVELIFDDMNPVDAFMADKFAFLNGLSVGNLISIGGGIAKAATGKTYSVQEPTNALLAAVIRDKTRSVTFKWGKMSFSGEITEVNANYTMFSVSGRPVRSSVRINITQKINEGDSAIWDTAFDNLFAGSNSGLSGALTGISNKAGNLMNFNF